MDFIDKPDAGQNAPDTASARRYALLQNLFFGLRIGITLIAVTLFFLSGASHDLAESVSSRFESFWPIANGLYLIITLFGFSVLMFPISLYAEHVLDQRFNLPHEKLDDWINDYLKSMILEIGLAAVFFDVVYILMRFAPIWWWIGAALLYSVFVVILATIAPVYIMPLFYKFQKLDNLVLATELEAYLNKEHVPVEGIYQCDLDSVGHPPHAALTGTNRHRRIILDSELIEKFEHDEILAIIAHETGHLKHRDMTRLILIGILLSFAGFFIAHLFLDRAVAFFHLSSVDDISSFPLFMFALFAYSIVAMPLRNTYSRHREFAADKYAIQSLGTAEPLIHALEKMATDRHTDAAPHFWIEVLLHNQPSIARRIKRARAHTAS